MKRTARLALTCRRWMASGTRFAVWAPNAIIVSVVGNFNNWDARRTPMRARTGGVWEIFVPGVGPAMLTSTK